VRKILHIDMDAFYASVEQRDNVDLRGKPVIVAWKAKRSVVCAASYEARAFGVRAAMPAVQAERVCPGAVFVPPDFTRYRAVSHDVREIFKRHTDLIEPLSLDEAYLDVTENKMGLPTATLVARRIREQIREELNLTASAGVAPNKFLAKIASDWRKPDGLFVIQPDDVDAFLSPLPVGRLPGVGKVTGKKLAQLAIQTVGDLRRLDSQVLEQHFGRYGVRLHELARGVDSGKVVPDGLVSKFELLVVEVVAKLVAQRAQKRSERSDFLAHGRSHTHADEHCVGAVVSEEFACPAFPNTQRPGSQNTNVTGGNLIKLG
jgi:DNA polymerase IV